jgi:hypothetical protein
MPDLSRDRFVFPGALGFASAYNPGNFLQTFGVAAKGDPGHLLKVLLY